MISNKLDRLIYTIFILIVYKFLCVIPLPYMNAEMLDGSFVHEGICKYFNLMAGSSIQRLSILALGLSPHMLVSIMMKVSKNVFDELKAHDKDPLKRKQMTRISRWLTLFVALVHSITMIYQFRTHHVNMLLSSTIGSKAIIAMYLICGSIITMWFTERINYRGIGNGFSLIVFTSVVSSSASSAYHYLRSLNLINEYGNILKCLFVLFVFNVFLIIFAYVSVFSKKRHLSPLLIPIGLLVYGVIKDHILIHLIDNNNIQMLSLLLTACIFSLFMFIILAFEDIIYKNQIFFKQQQYKDNAPLDEFPMKLNPAGITPAIFAENSMFVMHMILGFLDLIGFFVILKINPGQMFYSVITIIWKTIFIFMISYIWVSIEFEAKEISERMSKSKAVFPGVAEGLYTERFIDDFVYKLSTFGAIYLVFVVILPDGLSLFFDAKQILTGKFFHGTSGTSIIILVACGKEMWDRLFLSPEPKTIIDNFKTIVSGDGYKGKADETINL